MESINDNFLVQILNRLTRGEVLLGLVIANMDVTVKGVKIRGSLGCSEHALIEFMILRSVGLAKRVESGP